MSYPGEKHDSGVYQTLINLMPPHDTYIETFLGAGAVMCMKRPAGINIGIDCDPEALRHCEARIAGTDEAAGAAGAWGKCKKRYHFINY